MIEVELPDGKIAEFPDNTSNEAMEAALASYKTPPAANSAAVGRRTGRGQGQSVAAAQLTKQQQLEQSNPELASVIGNMSGTEKFLVGTGEGLTNVARGIGLMDDVATEDRANLDALRDQSGAAVAGSLIGETVGAAPIGLGAGALAGRAALGLAGRIGTGAVAGGAEGNVIARGQGASGDDILTSTFLGAGVGGVAEAALAGLARATGKRPEQLVPEDIERQFAVQNENKQLLESWGLTPTRAEVTQDATQLGLQKYYQDDEAIRINTEKNRVALANSFETKFPVETNTIDDAFEQVRLKAQTEDEHIASFYDEADEAAAKSGKAIKYDNVKKFFDDNSNLQYTNPFFIEMKGLFEKQGMNFDPAALAARNELSQSKTSLQGQKADLAVSKSDLSNTNRTVLAEEVQPIQAQRSEVTQKLNDLQVKRDDLFTSMSTVRKDIRDLKGKTDKASVDKKKSLSKRLDEMLTERDSLISQRNTLNSQKRELLSKKQEKTSSNRNLASEESEIIRSAQKQTAQDLRNVNTAERELPSSRFVEEPNITAMMAKQARIRSNSYFNKSNGDYRELIKGLNDAIDEDIFKSAGDSFWKRANAEKSRVESARSPRTGKYNQRDVTLVRDIIGGKLTLDNAVDSMFNQKGKYKAEDLEVLKDYLGENSGTWLSFKNAASRKLQEAAQDKRSPGLYDSNNLRKAIEEIGKRKMDILYTPGEQDILKEMGKVMNLTDLKKVSSVAPEPLTGFQRIKHERILAVGTRIPGVSDLFKLWKESIENGQRKSNVSRITNLIDDMEIATAKAVREYEAKRAAALSRSRAGQTTLATTPAAAVSTEQAMDDEQTN